LRKIKDWRIAQRHVSLGLGKGICRMFNTLTPHDVARVIVMVRDSRRSELALRGFIADLEEEAQHELVALMWIGRGAFEAEDWDEALATAANEATTPTADYLTGTPHLAENLEAGLEALGYDVTEEEEDVL
jgi:hypothetical protein